MITGAVAMRRMEAYFNSLVSGYYEGAYHHTDTRESTNAVGIIIIKIIIIAISINIHIAKSTYRIWADRLELILHTRLCSSPALLLYFPWIYLSNLT